MRNIYSKIEELASHTKDYIKAQIDLAKLTAAEKISLLLSGIISGIIAAFFFILVIVFGSVAAAYALSAWIGAGYAGFLIVAAFYLVVGMVLWLTRDRLIRIPIMNSIIRQLFQNKQTQD